MRYLHTMIRVGNLDRSIQFYVNALGFEVVKQEDHPDDKFSLTFLRSKQDAGTERTPQLELTYNYGVEKYDLGKGYGHVAYQVDSMEEAVERIRKAGFELSWGPGKTPDGRRSMAFVKDPDGYQIELIQGA